MKYDNDKKDESYCDVAESRVDVEDSSSTSSNEGSVDPADSLFARAAFLRALRDADEAERASSSLSGAPTHAAATTTTTAEEETNKGMNGNAMSPSTDSADTGVKLLRNGQRILCYDNYLKEQLYYDDLKHIDYTFIDYSVAVPVNAAKPLALPNQPETMADTVPEDDENGGHLQTSHTSSSASIASSTRQAQAQAQALSHTSRVIIEQDKRLGKGGLCWDAAFILGEYLVATLTTQRVRSADTNTTTATNTPTTTMIELGSGTGLCGLYIAKALAHLHIQNVHVALTDLSLLLPLLQRNVHRNFHNRQHCQAHDDDDDDDDDAIALAKYWTASHNNDNDSNGFQHNSSCGPTQTPSTTCCGTVHASVLQWGDRQAEERHGTFDIVLGADVVATLYDPIELAHTIQRLCHANSVVYISFKERLSTLHRQFEAEMATLFGRIEVLHPTTICSRNRNPNVHILVAHGKA